ncbi:hypothetical protein J4410_02565 [Candidatus Woesearchaeota archaeon]|nr:hypothetical protein [Candidatus Woesearchaeota archaeon]
MKPLPPIFFILLSILFFVTACAGPDMLQVEDTSSEDQKEASIDTEEEQEAEQEELDLTENKFIITPGTTSSVVKAIFEGKVEDFTIENADVDLVLFDLKEKYDVSLSYVREHSVIEGLSYFDYKQKQEQKEEETSGVVQPVRIQVQFIDSQGKANVEALFESGNIDTFSIESVDEDVINFDLADKYEMTRDAVKRLTKYFDENEQKPDINEFAEKLDEGLQEFIVQKDTGTLRSVGCDFFKHIITFEFMLEGDQNATIYGEDIGPYTGKRILRFKLNSQNLPELKCGADGLATEFEPNVLYRCTNIERGVYWKGEDERYSDKPDILAIQLVGGYDQIQFKCT